MKPCDFCGRNDRIDGSLICHTCTSRPHVAALFARTYHPLWQQHLQRIAQRAAAHLPLFPGCRLIDDDLIRVRKRNALRDRRRLFLRIPHVYPYPDFDWKGDRQGDQQSNR